MRMVHNTPRCRRRGQRDDVDRYLRAVRRLPCAADAQPYRLHGPRSDGLVSCRTVVGSVGLRARVSFSYFRSFSGVMERAMEPLKFDGSVARLRHLRRDRAIL